MRETELLELISKESSWQEVIEYILHEEGMDPWDIDIVKLSESFSKYLNKITSLDFKIPARLIIISAVLIRMKASILIYEEQEEKEEKEKEEFSIDLSKVPDLQAPVVRTPTRKVTLDELVSALDRAFSTKEKRETREYRAKERVEEVVDTEGEFDISAKIDELYTRISGVVDELREGEMKFSSLVTQWTRKEVVESFLPVLHLTTEGKISINQNEHFNEIYIKVRDDYEESEN